LSALPDRDVEVHDVLAHAELFIKRNRGIVTVIGLNEDDIGTTSRGNPL